jgi:hypothetical protein
MLNQGRTDVNKICGRFAGADQDAGFPAQQCLRTAPAIDVEPISVGGREPTIWIASAMMVAPHRHPWIASNNNPPASFYSDRRG